VKKTLKIVKLWLPPIIWASVIFLFSSYPTGRASEIYWKDFIVKKSAHVVEYAIFSTLLYRAIKESGVRKVNAGIFAITIAVIYAASDEFHQSFTPGREPTVRDVIFDTIGASLAIYTIWNLLPKAPKKLKNWAKNLQLL
jgi:VanZ family protein